MIGQGIWKARPKMIDWSGYIWKVRPEMIGQGI